MLLIIIVLLSMILWTVLNWKSEWDHMIFCFQNVMKVPPFMTIVAIAKLAGDIFLVSIAINILGLGGFYGAIGGLFLSNIMSVVFFRTSRKEKEVVKQIKFSLS